MNFDLGLRPLAGTFTRGFRCGCRYHEHPSRQDRRVAGSTLWHFCSDEHESWATTEDAEGFVGATELGLCAGRHAA